ncbi:MAG: RNA polymerase sigma factor [Acidimicrobiales bacterium]
MTPGLEAGDAGLVGRLLDGDETAFAGLVRQWSPAMIKLATLYVDDRAAAEEVVQDSWLAVITGVGDFSGRGSLRSWVLAIVANRARTCAVRERRAVAFSSMTSPMASSMAGDEGPGADRFAADDAPGWPGAWLRPPRPWQSAPPERPDDGVVARELRDLVEGAIAGLPRREREVVTCRDVLDLSSSEVCQMFGLSAINQRVLLHRARARCRATLAGYLEVEGP